jgi:hypothetical protein
MEDVEIRQFDNLTMEEWKNGKMEWWNSGKPKGKPQRGEMFVELAGNVGFGGAAYRNMKWNYWELDFTGDNDVSLRCSF